LITAFAKALDDGLMKLDDGLNLETKVKMK
jgi:hypothetical protein